MDFLRVCFLSYVLLLSKKTVADDERCEGFMGIGLLPLKNIDYESNNPHFLFEGIKKISTNWMDYSPNYSWTTYNYFGTCYNVTFKHINLQRDEWHFNEIHNKQALEDLEFVDVVVGHHLPAVERYCKEKKMAYMLSIPPTIELENRMIAENNSERVMFSTWPSWENFFELSLMALRKFRRNQELPYNKPIGRVFIFVEGSGNDREDGELYAVASKLADVMQFSKDGADAVFVRLFSLADIGATRGMSIIVREVMVEYDADVFVYMYNSANNLKNIMEGVGFWPEDFTKIFSGKDRYTQWFFWDMRTNVNGILSKLLTESGSKFIKTVHVRNVGLYSNNPFDLPCDNITTDITELLGASDGVSMSILNTHTIPEPEFTRLSFLNALRKTKLHLAGVKDRSKDLWRNIYSGWSFKNGFRVFAAVSIGSIRPNATKEQGNSDIGQTLYRDCRPKLEFFLSKYWSEKTKRVEFHNEPLEVHDSKKDVENKIVAVLEEPFVIYRANSGSWARRFSGIAPDIVKEAFTRMSRNRGKVENYEIYNTIGRNEYGMFNFSTKKWTGALGQLEQKKAVMAIGMFSKTKMRQRDFEFSPTFEFVGITFLIKRSSSISDYLSFMRPFRNNVWWGLLGVMIASSVFIHLLDRWNPFMEKVEPEKRFHINESLWYSFGTITQAGGEFAPVMYPTRLYSCFYWFFALVVAACYTGNLASFLVERFQFVPVKDLYAIPSVRKLKWATLRGSYMEEYIRRANTSKNDLTGLARGLGYVPSYKDGAYEAGRENFAFIGTNLLLQYHAAKDPDCDLAVGPHMESFTEIAFPMRHDWHHKEDFKRAMLSMRMDGTIRRIMQRWISKTKCKKTGDDDDETQLTFDSFQGILIVLGAFIILSYIVLFIKLGALKLKEKHEKLVREAEIGTNKREEADRIELPMIEAKSIENKDILPEVGPEVC